MSSLVMWGSHGDEPAETNAAYVERWDYAGIVMGAGAGPPSTAYF